MNRKNLLIGLILGFAATLVLNKVEAGHISFRGSLSVTSVT